MHAGRKFVDSGFLPPGLTLFGKGMRLRASGISMMANDVTFEAGMAKMNCGNSLIGASARVLASDVQLMQLARKLRSQRHGSQPVPSFRNLRG